MPVQSRQEQRRDRIHRGSSKGATLGQRADMRAAIIEAKTAIDLGPHIDRGANTIDDIIARDAANRSMAADSYEPPKYVDPPTSKNHPALRVPLSFLLADLRAGVKFWTRGLNKVDRLDVATDAFMVIVNDWTRQGETAAEQTARHIAELQRATDKGATRKELATLRSKQRKQTAAPVSCGPAGYPPFKADWYDPDARATSNDGRSTRPMPNERARRAMRAAIIQAREKRDSDREAVLLAATPDDLSLDDPRESTQTTLAQAALVKHQRTAEFVPSIPDGSPDDLADALGVTLSCARHLHSSGYRMSVEACAEAWGVSKSRAENIRSAGKREVLTRWPDSNDLLSALAAAGPTYRENLKTRAYLALDILRDGNQYSGRAARWARATEAINAYRAAVHALPYDARAIELAARRLDWTPEAISATGYLRRLLRAEQHRGQRATAIAGYGSGLPGQWDSASSEPLSRFRAPVPRAPEAAPIIGQTRWAHEGSGYSGSCSIVGHLTRWQREQNNA